MRLIDADLLEPDADYDDGDCWAVSMNQIKGAPTIEERKKGEWIDITNDESLDKEYECSVCGYELFYSNPTKYCPNCGAECVTGENNG